MIIETEFTPIIGNCDLALKTATLMNNGSLREVKNENKNKEVLLLKMILYISFSSLEKSLKKKPYFILKFINILQVWFFWLCFVICLFVCF